MMNNPCSPLENHSGCIQNAIDIIGSKWTALLLRDLATGPKRFGDFERSICTLNPRTLSRRLDDLETQGIIKKCPSDTPLHQSYTLTQKGRDLLPVLRQMAEWGEKYNPIPPSPTSALA